MELNYLNNSWHCTVSLFTVCRFCLYLNAALLCHSEAATPCTVCTRFQSTTFMPPMNILFVNPRLIHLSLYEYVPVKAVSKSSNRQYRAYSRNSKINFGCKLRTLKIKINLAKMHESAVTKNLRKSTQKIPEWMKYNSSRCIFL